MLYLEPVRKWFGGMLCRVTAAPAGDLAKAGTGWFSGPGYVLVDLYEREALVQKGAIRVAHRQSPAYTPDMDVHAGQPPAAVTLARAVALEPALTAPPAPQSGIDTASLVPENPPMPRRRTPKPTAPADDGRDPVLYYLTTTRPLLASIATGEVPGPPSAQHADVPTDEQIAAKFVAVRKARKAAADAEDLLRSYFLERFDELLVDDLAVEVDGQPGRLVRIPLPGRETLNKVRLVELGVDPDLIDRATDPGMPTYRLDVQIDKTPAVGER